MAKTQKTVTMATRNVSRPLMAPPTAGYVYTTLYHYTIKMIIIKVYTLINQTLR